MKVDDAWKSLSQVNEWIRFADAKAVAVLAGSGVLGGLLVKAIPRLGDFKIHTVHAILLSIAILCVGGSALIALRILAPRLRASEARSLIYFDHIARRYPVDRNGYIQAYAQLGEDETRLAQHIAEQVWSNSRVARRKFRRVSFALILLGIAMASSGASVIVSRIWS